MLTQDQIDTMFPNGLAIRVRTGRKTDDGKHIAEAIKCLPGAWTSEFVATIIEAGGRALVAEKLNQTPTDGGQKLVAARTLFAQADRGEMPEVCVRVRGSGTADPVLVEAIRLARVDVLRALKVKNMAEAAASEAGKKYFNTSANGSVSDNVTAFESFIERNPSKSYMERAQAIVDARTDGADEPVDVDL